MPSYLACDKKNLGTNQPKLIVMGRAGISISDDKNRALDRVWDGGSDMETNQHCSSVVRNEHSRIIRSVEQSLYKQHGDHRDRYKK